MNSHALPLAGWDQASTWEVDGGLYYARLTPNDVGDDDISQVWITPPQHFVRSTTELSHIIAAATGAPADVVDDAMSRGLAMSRAEPVASATGESTARPGLGGQQQAADRSAAVTARRGTWDDKDWENPVAAGRAAQLARRPRASCPYRLDSPRTVERVLARAWVQAWDAANPMSVWDDDADPDVDPPSLAADTTPRTPVARRMVRLESRARDAIGLDAHAIATCFRSGAVDLTIRTGGHLVSIQGTSDGEWGYSIDWPEDEGFMGHDHVTTSLDRALSEIRERLRTS